MICQLFYYTNNWRSGKRTNLQGFTARVPARARFAAHLDGLCDYPDAGKPHGILDGYKCVFRFALRLVTATRGTPTTTATRPGPAPVAPMPSRSSPDRHQ